MAILLGSKPVDEVQFMRKIVIDGSNTTGFQRTALVAMNGHLNDVRISTLTLEEDAARKLTEKRDLVNYGLDRLGIPLIEITTAADITSPDHAREVAEQLGLLLQATKKVKRGLGTIRQDLNISVANGARIEVKGIQSLSSIAKVAKIEVLRQLGILGIAQILQRRIKKSDIETLQSVDVSSVFSHTASKIIQNQLKDKTVTKGIRLPGYHGLLEQNDTRIGKDLALFAGLASGIGGIIHSDEMPGYGFSEQEIKNLQTILQMGPEDAFVLALGNQAMADGALNAVKRRAAMFLDGVPEEVRRSLSDDTTEYMRPLPGAARMYPETDVPPVRIAKERLDKITLPEKPEEKRKRFAAQYNLNDEQIKQLLSHGYEDDFEYLANQFPSLKNVIIRTFLNTLPELENESIPIETIDQKILTAIFSSLLQEQFSKEAVPSLLTYFVQNPTGSLEDAIQGCGVHATESEEVVRIVRKIVAERKEFVKERGTNALGPLMGVVMKELRGKADGKLISKTLGEEIQKVLLTK
jgi:glutamyl-tRNA(Gln) amidotransferase subunit E